MWMIGVFLVFLWVLGMATSHTFGGAIHVLVGLAVLLFIGLIVRRQKAGKLATAERLKKRRAMIRRAGHY